jgi:hypothetical protein
LHILLEMAPTPDAEDRLGRGYDLILRAGARSQDPEEAQSQASVDEQQDDGKPDL